MTPTPLHNRTFLFAVIVVSIAFLWLLRPFYAAIFWAFTLAVLLWPIHRRIVARMPGRRNLASGATLLASTLIVIIPLALIGLSLVREISALYLRVTDGGESVGHYLQQIAARVPPQVWQWLDRFGLGGFEDIQETLSKAATQALSLIYTHAVGIGQNTLQFAISFGVMMYLLFFFFRDGRQIVQHLRRAIPLQAEYLDALAANVAAVVKATIRGNVVVAAIQGALGGVMFLALGIPGPALWGVVMAFLSLLPAIGAGLVWAPVAIYLLATGAIAKGVVMIVIGAGVIGTVDNLLRPILVGRQTRMPDYLILISTLGGLSLFGPSGFVAGPLVAALFIALWRLWIERNDQATAPPMPPEV